MMAPETVVTVDHNKPAPQGGPPQQQGGALDWLKINVDYFKTPPGLLKVVELVSKFKLNLLCRSTIGMLTNYLSLVSNIRRAAGAIDLE